MKNATCVARFGNSFTGALSKVKAGAKKFHDEIISGVLSGYMAMAMAPVHAAGDEDIPTVTINQDAGTTEIFGRLLGMVIWITRFVGGFLLLWGIVMFAMALKNDEPESKQKAILAFVSGAVLLGLQQILVSAGIISVG